MAYRDDPSRPDRAKAIGAVLALHAGIAALVLAVPRRDAPVARPAATVLVDVPLDQPPPDPPPRPEPGRPDEAEGKAGKTAEPSPIVAPQPPVPAPTPVVAAPVAGTGSAASAGAATQGSGPGAGGSGLGRGGGGAGGGSRPAEWVSGTLRDSDYPRSLLKQRVAGTVSVRFTVLPSGRITDCRAVRSSGSAVLDRTTCQLLTERLRFRPATDSNGTPIASSVGSDYTWGVRQRY